LTLNNHQQSFYYVSFIIENCITFNVYFHNLNFIRRRANKLVHYSVKYVLYNSNYR
jgi:hypothetical protein